MPGNHWVPKRGAPPPIESVAAKPQISTVCARRGEIRPGLMAARRKTIREPDRDQEMLARSSDVVDSDA
jgi:hypothetical protein